MARLDYVISCSQQPYEACKKKKKSLILDISGERKRQTLTLWSPFCILGTELGAVNLSDHLGDRDGYPHFKIRMLTSEVKQFFQEHQVSGTTGIFPPITGLQVKLILLGHFWKLKRNSSLA